MTRRPGGLHTCQRVHSHLPHASPWLTIALAALAGAAFPSRGSAQTLTVQIVAVGSSDPVAGALVYLDNAAGETIRRSLTDDDGRARFYRFGRGAYRLRAEMIGMSSAESDVFEVAPDATLQRELAVTPAPIRLEGLSVAGDQRCRIGVEGGLAVSRLWDEARKALTATTLTDQQRGYRYRTMIYEQDLDRDTRVVRRTRESRREASMATPFKSRPIDELMARGYVEQSGGLDLYFAPDAAVLLSEPFLDTHCFRARAGSESRTEGLVGLAFEPTADRRSVVEVRGTLWLDAATSELRWLEYRYVGLDEAISLDELGGRVEFERLDDGGWIVSRWWIRMPRISIQRTLGGDSNREYVAGFREAGGMVLDVQGRNRAPRRRYTGALEGVVTDSLGAPLPGIRAEIVGGAVATETDSTGTFRMDDLVQGVYELQLVDPALERLGIPPMILTGAVDDGEVTSIEASMPSVRVGLMASCSSVPPVPEWQELARDMPSKGIVFGWLTDADTDEPIPDVAVQVITPTVEFRPGRARTTRGYYPVALGDVDLNESTVVIARGTFGVQTTTNDRGFYVVCGVPERHRIQLITVVGDIEGEPDEHRIDEPRGLLEHSVRVVRAPGP